MVGCHWLIRVQRATIWRLLLVVPISFFSWILNIHCNQLHMITGSAVLPICVWNDYSRNAFWIEVLNTTLIVLCIINQVLKHQLRCKQEGQAKRDAMTLSLAVAGFIFLVNLPFDLYIWLLGLARLNFSVADETPREPQTTALSTAKHVNHRDLVSLT